MNHLAGNAPRACRNAHSTQLAAAIGFALALASVESALAESAAPQLEEVIVTANRREQNVIDVPYNISAVSNREIVEAGIIDVQGLERVVPGVLIPDLGMRGNSVNGTIIMRGMNASDASFSGYLPYASVPLVSTYVDDVAMFTNLNLMDVDRVEVLRGPQGTLYGSGAVAGTVRLIHARPDPSQFTAVVNVEGSDTSHAANGSSRVYGIANIPLNADAALRVSAGYDRVAGFINAPNATTFGANGQPVLANPSDPLNSPILLHQIDHIDDAASVYGRASLLWNLSPTASIVAAYQYQRDQSGGESADTPGTPFVLQQYVPNAPLHRTVNLGSVTASADLGFATITSATSFYTNKSDSTVDVSFADIAVDANPPIYGGYPRLTGPIVNTTAESAATEELRLVSTSGGAWDYVAGLFFRHEYDSVQQIQYYPGIDAWSDLPGSAGITGGVNQYYGTNYSTFSQFQQQFNCASPPYSSVCAVAPSSVTPVDGTWFYNRNSSFLDRAVYGELTRHITKKWQITGGARMFWQDYAQSLKIAAPVFGPLFSNQNPPDARGTATGSAAQAFRNHLFKVNTSYAFVDNAQAYFTFSEGFRHGGVNAIPIGACGICDSPSVAAYKSDSAKNYEFGVKGETASKRLRYAVDVFLVKWQDIQINTSGASGDSVVVNGGTATTKGFELELTGQLTDAWSASFGYNYTDAYSTSSVNVLDPSLFSPAGVIYTSHDGDQLPNVSKNTLSFAVGYRQHLDQAHVLELNGNWNYHSDSNGPGPAGVFGPGGLIHVGGFANANVSGTVLWGDHLTTRLFVDNVSNGRHVTSVALRGFLGSLYNQDTLGRPRTVGLNVGYRF